MIFSDRLALMFGDPRYIPHAASKPFLRWVFRASASILIIGSTTSISAAETGIEEIIVTAEKRSEDIQSVAISMQALSGEDAERLGVRQAKDILGLYANLSTNASNELNVGFTIRGVGTSNFHGNVSRAVGLYQDEVSLGTPFSGALSVFDMERIEVLRGPQNTLYGRNTTGGAISYISRKPNVADGLSGHLSAGYGSHTHATIDSAINLPLGNQVAIRVAGQAEYRDGLFTNLLNDEKLGEIDQVAMRSQLVWQPSDNTEFLLNYHYGRHTGTNTGNKANGIGSPTNPSERCSDDISVFTSATNCSIVSGFNPSNDDFHDVYLAVSPRGYVKIDGAFINASHTFETGMELTSITAVENTFVELSDDLGGANALIFNPMQGGDYQQFSQEIRLSSSAEAQVRWMVGAYYFKEDMLLSTVVRRDQNPSAPPGPGVNGEVIAYNLLDQEDRDLSLYGHADIDLTDQLTVSAGLRYTDNDKSAVSDFGVMVSPTGLFDPVNFISTQDLLDMRTAGASDPRVAAVAVPNFTLLPKQSLGEWGGKLGLEYRLQDDKLIYASYSRGFKSGGFDTRALAALNGDAGIPVGPEYLDAYEVGFKSDWLDGQLRFNAAAFYYDWQDAQIFSLVGGLPAFTNIPASKVVGLDTEIIWVPRADWRVQAGLGLMDSKITDAGGLTGVTEGHELNNAPSVSMTGMIEKSINLTSGTFYLSTDFRYMGDRFEGIDGSKDSVEYKPEIFEVNLRAEYRFGADEEYQISVWAENLTGEQYCLKKRHSDRTNTGAVPGLISGVAHCAPNDGKALFGISGRVRF